MHSFQGRLGGVITAANLIWENMQPFWHIFMWKFAGFVNITRWGGCFGLKILEIKSEGRSERFCISVCVAKTDRISVRFRSIHRSIAPSHLNDLTRIPRKCLARWRRPSSEGCFGAPRFPSSISIIMMGKISLSCLKLEIASFINRAQGAWEEPKYLVGHQFFVFHCIIWRKYVSWVIQFAGNGHEMLLSRVIMFPLPSSVLLWTWWLE